MKTIFMFSLVFLTFAAPLARSLDIAAQGNRPVYSLEEPGNRLAAGKSDEVPDRTELRLCPGLEIDCRFRLNMSKRDCQILAMKDGEYLLRVEGNDEGGHLTFFVQMEGKWEPRLRGPEIKTNIWYDVRAVWTGQSMLLTANGESFRQPRLGRVSSSAKPLQIGSSAIEIARLAIFNPGLERAALLAGLPAESKGSIPSKPGFWKSLWNSLSGPSQDTSFDAPCVLGSGEAWDGWKPINGASCTVSNNALVAQFPRVTAMLASPELSVTLAPYPFLCLDIQTDERNVAGTVDFLTDKGSGSLSFQLQSGSAPTVVGGSISDAWTGKLRRIALSFTGNQAPLSIRKLTLADHPVGTPSFYIRSLAPGRAKLRPGRKETIVACVQDVVGDAENITENEFLIFRMAAVARKSEIGYTDNSFYRK